MTKKRYAYQGWIALLASDNGNPSNTVVEQERAFLSELGVLVGPFSEQDREFIDCVVSDQALGALDPHWGRFIWGLSWGPMQ